MLPVPPLDPLPRPRDRVETVRSTTAAALAAHAARAVTERGVEAWPQAAAAPVRPDSPNASESRAQPQPAARNDLLDAEALGVGEGEQEGRTRHAPVVADDGDDRRAPHGIAQHDGRAVGASQLEVVESVPDLDLCDVHAAAPASAARSPVSK